MASELQHEILVASSMWIAALVVGCGCGATLEDPSARGSTGSGSSGPSEASATSFLSALAMLDCDEAFTCKDSFPHTGSLTFEQVWGGTPQQCYALYLAKQMPAVVEAEVAQDLIKFDQQDAEECIARTTFGDCKDYWQNGPNYDSACDTALQGSVANGKACVVDFECASAFCNVDQHVCTR